MTRYLMSLEEAVELVIHAFKHAETGDIMVQKAPASTVGDLAQALLELFEAKNEIKIIGASSDHLMIDLNNQDHYQIGDKLQFSLNYEALSQSMYMKNLTKSYYDDSKIQTLIENFNTTIFANT